MKRFDDENDKIEPDTSDDPDLEGGEEKASEEYDDDKETESDIHGPASSPKYNSGIVGKGDEEQEEVGDDTSTNENSNLNTTTTITPVSANHDLKISPVDCIMEGFEVASNLANLDGVCSTMICPAPHAIEVEDSDDNVAKIPENKESAETDLVLTARKTEEPEDSSSVEDKQVLTEKEQNGSTNSDAYPGKKEEMDVLP